CAAVEHDDRTRVVVLTARGRVFSAGLPGRCAWAEPTWPGAVGAGGALTKPVLAAPPRAALGWGGALAMACDVRIAARTARLALPEVGQGRLPGGGVTARLARTVGVARALELVLLGERLSAPRAVAWGLVRAAVEPGKLAVAVEA